MIGHLEKHELKICREAAAECLYSRTRQVSRALGQIYEGTLQESGIRGGQLPIFIALAQMKSPTIGQLGKVLVMDRTTLTRNLKPLQREGFVRIEPGEDRRTRMISLTSKGYRSLSKALPLWKRNHDRVLRKLGRNNAESLLDHLSFVIEMTQKE